jgi:hypothetical protein
LLIDITVELATLGAVLFDIDVPGNFVLLNPASDRVLVNAATGCQRVGRLPA